jgi:hypothetical protein
MNKRVILATVILACVALAALAFGAVACGSGGAAATTTMTAPPTTMMAAPTTTTAPPTTAAAAATTTSGAATTVTTAGTTTTVDIGSLTLPTLQMTAEVQAYMQQMQAWAVTLQSVAPEGGDPLNVTDISKVTDAQVTAAEGMAAQAHKALDGLKAIKAPAELAAFHQALVGVIASAVDATDKGVQALQKRDQALFDAAKAQMDQIDTQMGSLMETLMPLLMGGTTTS